MSTSASNAIAEAQQIVQAGALPPFVVAPRHQSTIGLHLLGRWDRKSSGVAQKAWQRKMQHEQQMKQLASDILRVRSETEQLRQENTKLRLHNAKKQTLLSCVDQLCSSSIPQTPTGPDCTPSSP